MTIAYGNRSDMLCSIADQFCRLRKVGHEWHVIKGGQIVASLPLEAALAFAHKLLKKTVSKK